MIDTQKYAVLVVAYNRLESLKRVLGSLEKANYLGEKVTLIISVDKSNTKEVEDYAQQYVWKNGNKIVYTYPERLGLRNHIISCGNLLKDFDAMAILEDDTLVSPLFYSYLKQSVQFYENQNEIAGISLYNHQWQIDSDRPFNAANNRYDNYYLQYAQSWGQIWMKKQWFDFINWYNNNKETSFLETTLPGNLQKWPESSWLKYHIKYCIETNKYFVYPYVSLSTNFTDVGQHNLIKSTKYQVLLNFDTVKDYKFVRLEDKNAVIYDAFFERVGLEKELNLPPKSLTVNLYGKKKTYLERQFLLTTKIYDYNIVKTFGLDLKPHEMNILFNIQGNDIKLYDTSVKKKNSESKHNILEWSYDEKNKNIVQMVTYIWYKIKIKFVDLFN